MANSMNMNLTGKLVVIGAEHYTDDRVRTESERTVLVQGGFGAHPETNGSALFVRDNETGQVWRAEGYMVERIIGDCPPEMLELTYEVLVISSEGVEHHLIEADSPTKASQRVLADKGWNNLPRKLNTDTDEELLSINGHDVVIHVKKASS